jgi:hypothetical protein
LEKIRVADEGLGRPTTSSGTTLSSSSMVLGEDKIRILGRLRERERDVGQQRDL